MLRHFGASVAGDLQRTVECMESKLANARERLIGCEAEGVDKADLAAKACAQCNLSHKPPNRATQNLKSHRSSSVRQNLGAK
eukprot:168896-Amphidinium_carterae.1